MRSTIEVYTIRAEYPTLALFILLEFFFIILIIIIIFNWP